MALHRWTRFIFIAASLPLSFGSTALNHDDILGYPRYHVSLTEQLMPASKVYPELHSLDNVPVPKDVVMEPIDQSDNTVLMMSSHGQPFLCTIPSIEEPSQDTQPTSEPTEKMIQESIQRALKLLEPMSESCLFLPTSGYWTYEYCHMKHVRQFHLDRTAATVAALQNQNLGTPPREQTPSYILGVFSGAPAGQGIGSLQKPLIQNQRGRVSTTELRQVGDKRFLVQHWRGGTLCDLTGKPRSIEIQYHCDLRAQDRIAVFQEVATCQYQMIINTPRLCDELMLTSQQKSDVHTIECHPVVADHLIDAIEETSHKDITDQDEQITYDPLAAKDEQVSSDNEPALSVSTTKDDLSGLLGTIAALTLQIEDLQRQINGPEENTLKTGLATEFLLLQTPNNNDVLTDSEESVRQPLSENNDAPEQKQINKEDENTNRNQNAYQKVYF